MLEGGPSLPVCAKWERAIESMLDLPIFVLDYFMLDNFTGIIDMLVLVWYSFLLE